MCSVILRIGEDGVFIAANRDEMIGRPWTPPAAHWPELPGVIAGRDTLAGGTWMGLNRHGVMAAVLNRRGSLGPAPGKRSRGELPLIALAETTARSAAAAVAAQDAGLYRSFNVVIADRQSGYFLRGLEQGQPDLQTLGAGVWMVTAGEPNETSSPRIARHLPRFKEAPFSAWPGLLADDADPQGSALNIRPHDGFGTVCASVVALPRGGAPVWRFAAGPPHAPAFVTVDLAWPGQAR